MNYIIDVQINGIGNSLKKRGNFKHFTTIHYMSHNYYVRKIPKHQLEFMNCNKLDDITIILRADLENQKASTVETI